MLSNKTAKSVFTFAFLVLTLSLVSAVQSSILSSPASVNENEGSYTFMINVTNNGALTINTTFATSASFGSVSVPSIINLAPGSSKNVTATVTGFTNQGGNTQSITVNASATDATSSSISLNVPINNIVSLCPNGTKGDLEITDININNLGEGEDESWQPLDEIKIDIDVDNTNSDNSVSNIDVRIHIFDSDNKDVTGKFNFDKEKISLGKIKDGDSETATFNIPEVPADLDEGNYRIYVEAYSQGHDDTQCVADSSSFNKDTYHEVEFTRQDDKSVIVRSQDLASNAITTTCGIKDLTLNLPIYNIGTDKEDSVLVNVYNKELGIDVYDTVADLKSGKRTDVSFALNIPSNAKEGKYKLSVFTYFDYDKGDKMVDTSYSSNSIDDLNKDFKLPLEVVGCAPALPTISATLDSDAAVGKELVVKATIKNNGDAGNFVIGANGLDEWASLTSITPQSLNLASGQSGEAIIKLNPTTQGFHSFTIDALINGKSYSQPVSVNIAGTSAVSGINQNTLRYVVIALVVLIILLIIVIVAKMSGSASQKF